MSTQNTATSLSVLFKDETVAGGIVSINLCEANNLPTPLSTSPFNNFDASDTLVTFDLLSAPLPPGYYVAG